MPCLVTWTLCSAHTPPACRLWPAGPAAVAALGGCSCEPILLPLRQRHPPPPAGLRRLPRAALRPPTRLRGVQGCELKRCHTCVNSSWVPLPSLPVHPPADPRRPNRCLPQGRCPANPDGSSIIALVTDTCKDCGPTKVRGRGGSAACSMAGGIRNVCWPCCMLSPNCSNPLPPSPAAHPALPGLPAEAGQPRPGGGARRLAGLWTVIWVLQWLWAEVMGAALQAPYLCR